MSIVITSRDGEISGYAIGETYRNRIENNSHLQGDNLYLPCILLRLI